MKKLFVILLASMSLAACGDGSRNSEANRQDEENYENTTPSVSPDMESDTTSTDYMDRDTTSVGNDFGTETDINDNASGTESPQPGR
jgi:hypothetical protein